MRVMRVIGRRRRRDEERRMLKCSKCGKPTLVTYNLTGFCADCQREWDDMTPQPEDVVVVTWAKLAALEEVAKAAAKLWDAYDNHEYWDEPKKQALYDALYKLEQLEEKQA